MKKLTRFILILIAIIAVIIGLKFLINLKISTALFIAIFLFGVAVLVSRPKNETIKIATMIAVIVVGACLAWQAFSAGFPRTKSRIGIFTDRQDQTVYSITDPTKVVVIDKWEVYSVKAGERLAEQVDELLAQGKTEEAAQLYREFQNKWNPNKLLGSDSSEAANQAKTPQPEQAAGTKFEMGTLQVGEEHPWMTTHSFAVKEWMEYEVQGNPALLVNGNGGTDVIQPGKRYGGPMLSAGKVAFRAKDGPATVMVYY